MADCTCSTTTRCRYAWELRDAFRALPCDDTPATSTTRRHIVQSYTKHVAEAPQLRYSTPPSYAPVWDESAYPRPSEGAPDDTP